MTTTLGFAVLYVLANIIGRLTVMDSTRLSLVWPAAGVLVVWFVTRQRARWWMIDVAVAATILSAVCLLTGLAPATAVVVVTANITQALVFVVLFRRLLPGLWGAGGPALSRPAELWRFLAVAAASTAVGAAIGPTGLWLVNGTYSLETTFAWFTRHLVSVVIVGIAMGRAPHVLRRLRDGSARDIVRRLRPLRWLEYAVVVGLSVLADVVVFGLENGLPLSFTLMAMTVWAGLRLRTSVVVLHSLVLGIIAALFTLQGTGPFAEIGEPHLRAMIAQLFVGTLTVVGLALALGRDERAALLARLRESERAANEQARTMQTIVDNMSEGLAVIDENGRFRMRNPATAQLLGMSSTTGGVADNSYYGIFRTDGSPLDDHERVYRQVLDGTFAPTDLLVRNETVPEGRIIRVTGAELPRTDDGLRQVLLAFHDVTADRRHRDELAAFAGVVAHDLLNPLTTVEGWSEMLAAGDDPSTASGITRIQRAAARMRSLISGLLAYTTARDAGLSRTAVDLDAMIREVATGRLDNAACTGAPMPRFDIADLPTVTTDPVLTRQLLENLVGNAIKYTAPGVIPRLVVRCEARDGFARISVADNGIGIPPGQHEAIFQNFHRAHTDAHYSGTGLGLAICKRIVERHGGTITAGDNGPAGSRMTFTLPISTGR